LIGDSSAAYSSVPFRFTVFATDLYKALVSGHMPLFEMNNAAVRNSRLKYNQTDPPNESILKKNYLRNMKKKTLNRIVVL
jgi:hypothetical protein